MTLLHVAIWALAIAATFSCGYLLLLTLLSRKVANPSDPPYPLARRLRFDIIVPAHNEQALIARTVTSLLAIDWPQECFHVIVVADNCTDDTATLARAAGANVIERSDPLLRGKGYALARAFEASRASGWADAVVVVDADTDVSTNLLRACAARIANGAHAVQVHYGVRDPLASWRTRLMCIALSAFHRVRSRGRERLRVSCGLRGNGWCVTHALLKQVPYQAFSLTEDIEYGIQLGLAGYRVHYADEAYVNGEMVSDASSARTQRRRWEHGRFNLIRTQAPILLLAALRKRSSTCFDLAIDLLILPLSYIALNVVALLSCAALLLIWQPATLIPLWIGLACATSLLLYVLRGWQLSGMGARGLLDLARAPFFVAWKVVAMMGAEPIEWVRTKRSAP